MRKSNEFTRVLQVGMMLVLPFGLAACAPEDGDELDETPEATIPDADRDLESSAEPLNVDIEGVDSDVGGEATISRVGQSLMVSLTLEDLPAEGPFRAQILSGRCEDRDDMTADRPAGTTGTPGATTPSITGTVGAQAQGQVLATLEPVQVTGAAPGQTGTTTGQTGMSHSTIPVMDLQNNQQAFIEVQGQGNRTVACGNIDNLNQVLISGAGAAPAAPGTAPAGGTARP